MVGWLAVLNRKTIRKAEPSHITVQTRMSHHHCSPLSATHPAIVVNDLSRQPVATPLFRHIRPLSNYIVYTQ